MFLPTDSTTDSEAEKHSQSLGERLLKQASPHIAEYLNAREAASAATAINTGEYKSDDESQDVSTDNQVGKEHVDKEYPTMHFWNIQSALHKAKHITSSLSVSGNSRQKMHCGIVVNLPYI